MTPEEEVTRGRNAERLMRDEIYREAFATVRDRIVSQLSQAEVAGEKRDRLNNLLVGMYTVQRYIEQVAVGGKMAAQQIERDRTFTERVGDRLRKVV